MTQGWVSINPEYTAVWCVEAAEPTSDPSCSGIGHRRRTTVCITTPKFLTSKDLVTLSEIKTSTPTLTLTMISNPEPQP